MIDLENIKTTLALIIKEHKMTYDGTLIVCRAYGCSYTMPSLITHEEAETRLTSHIADMQIQALANLET